MQPREIEFVVAVDNEEIRDRVQQILRKAGTVPAVLGNSSAAYHLTPSQYVNGFIILETNDDIARLVQIVNDLHHSPYHPGGCVSRDVRRFRECSMLRSVALFWLIHGRAAVLFVYTPEMLKDLPGVILMLTRPLSVDLTTPETQY